MKMRDEEDQHMMRKRSGRWRNKKKKKLSKSSFLSL